MKNHSYNSGYVSQQWSFEPVLHYMTFDICVSVDVLVAGESTLAHKSGSKPKQPEPVQSHDIRHHLASLHKERKNEDPKAILADRIKTLRRILRKL